MRNSREKWVFFNHESKPVLNQKEVVYFKKMLERILKIGMEFEFNLPDKNGTCKGNSKICACKNMQEKKECWMECINVDGCSSEKYISRCSNVTGTCVPEDCDSCEHFKSMCKGIYCPNFVSKCYDCTDFNTQCDKCKDRYDPNRSPDTIRSSITKKLAPNNCYGVINESGVHSVTTDGSLLGKKGAEIITIGRRVDYWEFYQMAKNIIDVTIEKGGYVNERCSIHMHMLASYYSKLAGDNSENAGIPTYINELEKRLPQIVLANYHQLRRRYQNALTWMSMGLDDPERMTRWEKFRVSNLEISGVLNTMRNVRDSVGKNAGKNKYGFTNYKYTKFDRDTGDVSRLHIEMRELDGILSPSVVAALGCMHYAMMLKAVEISRYGVLEIGDDKWMERARRIKDAILNNMKDYQDDDRFGHTQHVYKYADTLIDESLDLVRQLKHLLIPIGPAYQVLEKLAERPVALRRCDGESWEKIENDFAVDVSEEDKYQIKISEYIDLRVVDQCNNVDEWIMAVSAALREDPDLNIDVDNAEVEEIVSEFIESKRNDGELIWSESIGSVMTLS